MEEKELLIQYMENQHECEWVDFKEKFYVIKNNKDCFIKDVVSFANNLQQKDKYIIFGVEDKNHNICGVSKELVPDIAILENLLFEKVEPQINIELGSFIIDDKLIIYIKIPYSNDNLPYIIKNECSSVKQGDIYIRRGSINVKASRRDLDDIYLNRNIQQIVPYDSFIVVEPINIKDSLIENPTYGRFDIEVTNYSKFPLLINRGWIDIYNRFGKIQRRICDILPNRNIEENPFQVSPNTHYVKTVLFNFLSIDCVTLHFDEYGQLSIKTYVKTFFEDTNGKVFESEPKEFYIICKGDVLHKIKLKYKEFRRYLKKQRKNILKAIEFKQDTNLKQLLEASYVDFSLLLPEYVLANPEFPEYDICAEMIQVAKNAENDYAIELMIIKGLPHDYVEYILSNMRNL